MIVRCHVYQCRHPETHVTSGHRCGLCGLYGHGQLECHDESAKRALDNMFRHDRVPSHLQCSIDGCMHRHTHMSASHHCHQCHMRGGVHRAWCGRANLAAPDDAPEEPLSPPSLSPPSFSPPLETTPPASPMRKCCPVCRTFNTFVGAPEIIFTAAECAVCMEKDPLIVFSSCRHACVCRRCFEKLD